MQSILNGIDQVIFHFDGNNNDPDDISALPMAAAIAKSAGLQDKTTFFYGNNLSEPDNDRQVAAMRESAAFAEKLGINTHSYQDGIEKTTNELVEILNSGQKILALEGGPMEAIYRALEQTSAANRENITLISHSSWNENRDVGSRPGGGKPRTWSDIRADFPEVTQIDIKDQNGSSNEGFNNPAWNWLDNTDNPVLEEAREKMLNAGGSKANDPSDAGMLFYAITGQQDADPADAKAFFEQNPPSFPGQSPSPAPIPTPSPVPTPIPFEPLVRFSLVNAKTDEIVDGYEDLANNSTIDLNGLDLDTYSLIAQVDSEGVETVQSIKFESSRVNRIENVKPYALYGDKSGDFDGQTVEVGDYSVKASVYTGKNGQGSKIATTDFNYTFIDTTEIPAPAPAPIPDPVPIPDPSPDTDELITFALVNADTNKIVEGFENLKVDGIINPNGLDLNQYNVIAQIDADSPEASAIKSVKFESNLGNRIENVVPYALFGDINSDYMGKSLKSGDFSVKATAYTQAKGGGEVIATSTVEFTVVNDSTLGAISSESQQNAAGIFADSLSEKDLFSAVTDSGALATTSPVF